MNMTRRERIIMIVAAVVIGLFLGDRWVFSPLWERYEADVQQAATLEQEVLKAGRLLRKRKGIRAEWEARRANGLADEVSVAEGSLLNRLEQWASDARLSVTSMKPERESAKKDAKVQRVRCRLLVTGRMESVARFCHRLETSSFPVRVETMQFTCNDPKRDALSVQFVVSTVSIVTQGDTKPGGAT